MEEILRQLVDGKHPINHPSQGGAGFLPSTI
jgi:hypothetical protein